MNSRVAHGRLNAVIRTPATPSAAGMATQTDRSGRPVRAGAVLAIDGYALKFGRAWKVGVLGAHFCIDRAQLRGGLSDDRLPAADVHVAVENELDNRPGTFSTTRTPVVMERWSRRVAD